MVAAVAAATRTEHHQAAGRWWECQEIDLVLDDEDAPRGWRQVGTGRLRDGVVGIGARHPGHMLRVQQPKAPPSRLIDKAVSARKLRRAASHGVHGIGRQHLVQQFGPYSAVDFNELQTS